VGIGIGIFIGINVVSVVILSVIFATTGLSGELEDAGDTFDQAEVLLRWGGERAKAIAENKELPDPPAIWADVDSLRLGFAATLVMDALLIATVGAVCQFAGWRELLKGFGMERFRPSSLKVTLAALVGLYAFVIVYSVLIDLADVSWLKPESTIPSAVTRDALTASMAGVLACLAAPLAEELFFRGLVFGGLVRWGFWPAAAASGAIFSASHLDPGSFVPFIVVGMTLAWLYWRRSNLWDAILFHLLFNLISFSLLMATS